MSPFISSSALRSASIVLLIFLLAAPALAQRPQGARGAGMQQQAPATSIEGRVLDADTGDPVGGAAVAVWRDGALVTGALTDPRGAFRVERLRPGAYRVEVSFLGYRPVSVDGVEINRQQLEADLGTIRLASDTAELDAVEVAAQREAIEIRADRTVYNVADDPTAETGSVSEVLEQLPSVEVDIDGNVSLRGNQNVAVLINGRTVPVSGAFLAAFLRQLPANALESVEVIPNPSARYDPQGMGGIINIVMKENTDLGLSGGVTLGGGSNGGYNGSANLAYQRGRISVAGTYGLRHDVRASRGLNFRENRYADPLTFLDQTSIGERLSNSHLFNGSFDYSIARRTTLGLRGMLSVRESGSDGQNAYLALDADRVFTDRYTRFSDSDSDGLNTDLALTFRHVIQPQRHELTAEARVSGSVNENLELFSQQAFDALTEAPTGDLRHETNRLDARSSEVNLQVDYNRPLPVDFSLETGYKGSFRGLENDLIVAPRATLSNAFDFDETIHAAYGLLTRSFGPVEAKGGARVEHASTAFTLENTGETYNNTYFSVFPSAFLVYSLSEARQLKASYSLRVSRPRTRQLNPFTTFDDPLNVRTGNPFLRPEYTHSVEAGYAQFTGWGSVQLTPYFRRTEDAIARRKTVDPLTGISTQTFENFATRDSYGTELIVSARPAPWLNGFVSFNGYRAVTDAGNVETGLGSDALGWTGRGNLQVQLPRGLALQAFGMYRAPMAVENGRISSFSMTNLSLRQRLMDDRASLTLQVRDVFDTRGFSFIVDDAYFYQEAQRRMDARAVTLAFSYTFGQQPRQRGQRGRGDRMEGGDMDADVGID